MCAQTKSFISLSCEKWEQKQECFVYSYFKGSMPTLVLIIGLLYKRVHAHPEIHSYTPLS